MRSYACCLSALRSGFVSRFGRARANDRFAVFSSTLRDGRLRLVPQPSRDGAARAVRRLLCGRDTAACMDLHIRDRIPGFHHGCDRARTFRGWRLRFAAALWPARVPHSTSNVSHLKEALLKLVEQRRGVTNRTRYPSENHNSTLGAVLGRAGIREIDASHIKQPCCPHQRPPGTHCWCHKHRTPSKRSEKPAIVAIDRRKEPESITGEPIRGHAAPPDSKTRRHAAGEQTRRHAAHTGPVQR